MGYPTIDGINEVAKGEDEIRMLATCIKCVYDEDNVYDPDGIEDSVQFIEGLNSQQFMKLTEFFNTMPKLRHKFTYKCAGCGQEDSVELEGLSDFF